MFVEYVINKTLAQSPALHTHDQYEMILYAGGTGVMHTGETDYPVSEGSIIIVPPGVRHGSESQGELERFYMRGDFHQAFSFDAPVLLRDNPRQEGQRLVQLLYENRFGNSEYIGALCTAFVQFLLMHMEIEDSMGRAVSEVCYQLTSRFADADLNSAQILRGSGYAEDYIRAHFKRITGKTPVEFLTDVRIRHACFLLEFHGTTLSLAQVAEQSGYTDYVYFSKKFKSVCGLSPRDYQTALVT